MLSALLSFCAHVDQNICHQLVHSITEGPVSWSITPKLCIVNAFSIGIEFFSVS